MKYLGFFCFDVLTTWKEVVRFDCEFKTRSIVVAKCVFVGVLILCVIVSCSEGGDVPLETKIKIHNEKEWVCEYWVPSDSTYKLKIDVMCKNSRKTDYHVVKWGENEPNCETIGRFCVRSIDSQGKKY